MSVCVAVRCGAMPVTLATAVTTVRGVANALAAVAKPHARLLSACFLLYKLLVAVLLRNRRRAGTATGLTSLVGDVLSTHTQAVLVFIGSFLACWVDPVVSTDRYTTKPGVYYHGQRAQRLARKAGLEQAVVDGERDLWPRGGDICTVVASESWKLFQAGTRNLQYFRTLFPLCVPKCERASTTMWRQNYMDTFAGKMACFQGRIALMELDLTNHCLSISQCCLCCCDSC